MLLALFRQSGCAVRLSRTDRGVLQTVPAHTSHFEFVREVRRVVSDFGNSTEEGALEPSYFPNCGPRTLWVVADGGAARQLLPG